MILLVTTSHPDCEAYGCGRLVQPRHYSSIERTAAAGIPWAADNDCYQGLDEPAFRKMLARIAALPGCLFVTAPDIVGDHTATLERWHDWAPIIRAHHLPAAFVLQDGCPAGWHPPDADAVFIGGTTDYKLGPDAAASVTTAKQRGIWAHMGRVNSDRRLAYAASIGCDSADGTKYARFKKTWLRDGIHAAAAPPQTRLVP